MRTKLEFLDETERKEYYMKRFEKKLDEEDWQYLKSRYVGGINKEGIIYFPDKAEILREWNENNPDKQLSGDYFYKQTNKRDWNKVRALVKRKVEGKRDIDELRAIISQSADFDTEALTAIKNLYRLINTSIVQKYKDVLDNNYDEEQIEVNTKDISDLVNCIPKLIKSTKDILGKEDDINIIEELRLLEEEEDELKDLNELEKELKELTATVKSKQKK